MKIMLVDDELDIREQAVRYLKDIYGLLDVRTFGNAREAIEELEKYYYSAVVSDYALPEINGLDFLKMLREKGNEIPFIIFTGMGDEQVAIKALNYGADAYIQKRDDPRTHYVLMAQTIKQVVEKHQSQMNSNRAEREKTLILDSLSEHVVHMNSHGIIIWGNKASAGSVGLKPEKLVGELCHELFFESPDKCNNCPLNDAIEKKARAESVITTDKGGVWYVRIEPVFSDNEIIGFLEIKEDITENIKIKEALSEQERMFQMLVDTAPAMIVIVKDGVISYHNRTAAGILGYGDKLGTTLFTNMIDEEQRELMSKRMDDLIKDPERGPSRYEVMMINSDNEKKWLYVSMACVYLEGERNILIVGIDISERKILENILIENYR